MPQAVIHFLTRLHRLRFAIPDIRQAALLAAVGLWLLQHSWMEAHYPAIARDMSWPFPYATWGVLCLIASATIAAGLLLLRPGTLALGHMLAFSLWLAIGWIFREAGPSVFAIIAPLEAVFVFVHLWHIPSDAHFSPHPRSHKPLVNGN